METLPSITILAMNKAHRQKLEKARASFRVLTSDGQYPSERQNRLYQACLASGLDWNEVRQFIQPEAEIFYDQVISKIPPIQMTDPATLEELQRLRRRLGLSQSPPLSSLPGQIQVNIAQAPQPATWKQRIIEILVFFKLSVIGCIMLIVGIIVLLILFSLCMAMYYMGIGLSTMPHS